LPSAPKIVSNAGPASINARRGPSNSGRTDPPAYLLCPIAPFNLSVYVFSILEEEKVSALPVRLGFKGGEKPLEKKASFSYDRREN